ncbi:indolepyruvate ferredoxin oxidoreductase family protein [Corticibacter populi]|uniref:Indolepyruvate ferredoxin oxidoreductase family protein n=1 Tax=Corticibacter populi TaxID=1550736 RepID=A0A3M6QPJ2_9BURK|nr:indolepyruvate ferredoxin oxidoreductase family protein [Corticibacter populi]RMX04990.1 indolepyruvate ferredoxin oxidoreductase family protein [Corticibacter populi]RZS33579.1 indolepyruvate ferredoxin oxidoreductase [Corticibacter populi]
MNAPLPPEQLRRLQAASIDDKYALPHGLAFMSGVQALVRLPMLQQRRDALAGLDTAGFISGYRGSPLGGYDQALVAARPHLQRHQVVFQPGVNEELAATAVWGSQQLDLFAQQRRHDGVFGIWYGKGPGVDRSVDVFKHANMAGTARHGGVLALAGDDHVAKSSTAAHQSDQIFIACGLPVFFPGSVQDILDMGLHAFALSRYSGLWAGMKTIQEVVESSASVCVDAERVEIAFPEDFEMPDGGLHIRWPDAPLAQEERLMSHKWDAALAYVRANRLNHSVIAGPQDRFGLMASGKAYSDTRQALADLGLDAAICRQLGIRLHKVNVVWPLEPVLAREFASGLQEVLVVEEKRPLIESQLKELLYHWPDAQRPRVLGKADAATPAPAPRLLRPHADLTPGLIARAIAVRLLQLGMPAELAARLQAHLAMLDAREQALAAIGDKPADRIPWFCSGCPHNTSTRVPEGSRALAGIGCHYMANWMPDRHTSTFSQMGGEGVAWVGQQPFTKERHVFANLGDGTYFHSGLLAIRQSIAADVNITYKILYNNAVAMTGGQQIGERPEGHSVLQIMASVLAEGAAKVVIVTDEPDKYAGAPLAPGVAVHHRNRLDAIQRELREVAGTSVLIYDQTCATEKRRRRKRGTLADPPQRVFINERVCEGCGDCSVQSNCLSVEPLETEFGRKRRINQSSCNKDFSCVKGFCPSFVTIEGGQLRRKTGSSGHPAAATTAEAAAATPALAKLPTLAQPQLPPLAQSAWAIVVAGVGGTGVITIGQLLGMAAHLDGKGVVTQDAGGLAQKGGATWSHVQIARAPEFIHSTRVDAGHADLVIGCDAIVAASAATLAVMQTGRTQVVLNRHGTPTAAFVHDPGWRFPAAAAEAAIGQAIGKDGLNGIDAEELATGLLGDSIYTNPLLLGFAWQSGLVPLSHAALMRAIELNAVQVEKNQAAFEWGRHAAAHRPAVQALLTEVAQAAQPAPTSARVIPLVRQSALQSLIEQRAAFLTDYQNAAYAQRYRDMLARVRAIEGQTDRLTSAVARNLFKLMAYKDEYEVARLYTDGQFARQVAAQFEGDYRLHYHLAPPLMGRRSAQGQPVKQRFGPWLRPALAVLARLRFLRGSRLDPFGHTAERRQERALIVQYIGMVETLLQGLAATAHQPMPGAARWALAVRIASVPEQIRGYGHVKAAALERAQALWQELWGEWQAAEQTPSKVA